MPAPIHCACPKCQTRIAVPPHLAGGKGACPRCGQSLLYPAPVATALPPPAPLAQIAPVPVPDPAWAAGDWIALASLLTSLLALGCLPVIFLYIFVTPLCLAALGLAAVSAFGTSMRAKLIAICGATAAVFALAFAFNPDLRAKFKPSSKRERSTAAPESRDRKKDVAEEDDPLDALFKKADRP